MCRWEENIKKTSKSIGWGVWTEFDSEYDPLLVSCEHGSKFEVFRKGREFDLVRYRPLHLLALVEPWRGTPAVQT
jgi:hypothetical protein